MGAPRHIDGDPARLADGGQHRPRVDLFLGRACNNDCVFCNEGGRGGRRRVYSLEEAAQLLERTAGLETVFLTGGEPTLNRELLRYVELVRKRDVPHIALITNGRRLARGTTARDLLAAGVNEVRVSVHGHTPALHDRHVRAAGAFAEVEAGLTALATQRRQFPLHLIVLVVVTRWNLPYLHEMYRWAQSRGADRVGFGVVRPSGLAVDNWDEIIPRYADVAEAFQRFLGALTLREDPVNVDSVPACLLPGAAAFIGARMRLVSLADGEGLLERDEYWEKAKGPPCQSCLLRASCEGVWEGYATRYGWDEFSPVTAPPWGPDDAALCAPSRLSGATPDAPLLSLGERCNSGCTPCTRPGHRAPGAPAAALLLDRLTEIARAGAESVRLGGGEPLLNEILPELLRRSAELGLRVELLTNARLLAYPATVERMRPNPPDRISTVLFGPDAPSHDAATRVTGSFRQTLRGVRNARAAGWPVKVTLTAAAAARASLVDALERLGCDVDVS